MYLFVTSNRKLLLRYVNSECYICTYGLERKIYVCLPLNLIFVNVLGEYLKLFYQIIILNVNPVSYIHMIKREKMNLAY